MASVKQQSKEIYRRLPSGSSVGNVRRSLEAMGVKTIPSESTLRRWRKQDLWDEADDAKSAANLSSPIHEGVTDHPQEDEKPAKLDTVSIQRGLREKIETLKKKVIADSSLEDLHREDVRIDATLQERYGEMISRDAPLSEIKKVLELRRVHADVMSKRGMLMASLNSSQEEKEEDWAEIMERLAVEPKNKHKNKN